MPVGVSLLIIKDRAPPIKTLSEIALFKEELGSNNLGKLTRKFFYELP
tara:strand:+ start:1597 stop:1740 length:144 start_codon:yes stop_codon:yes gene_type:complete